MVCCARRRREWINMQIIFWNVNPFRFRPARSYLRQVNIENKHGTSLLRVFEAARMLRHTKLKKIFLTEIDLHKHTRIFFRISRLVSFPIDRYTFRHLEAFLGRKVVFDGALWMNVDLDGRLVASLAQTTFMCSSSSLLQILSWQILYEKVRVNISQPISRLDIADLNEIQKQLNEKVSPKASRKLKPETRQIWSELFRLVLLHPLQKPQRFYIVWWIEVNGPELLE